MEFRGIIYIRGGEFPYSSYRGSDTNMVPWEKLNNPQFKGVGFAPSPFQEAGSNAFTLNPTKCTEQTNTIGN